MIPEHVNFILSRLRQAGFLAYAVGGCVRDLLRGEAPHDWDVCTSALPDETERVFFDCPQILTGKKHGTVAVVVDNKLVEITTFRTDGAYLDNRHPEAVTFLTSLEGDLARRDFTVNAMALDENEGPIDLFGGQADLTDRIIRTVGDPAARFREDGLRILRGLRFASRLDFAVEPATAQTMIDERALLHNISAERIFSELKGILTGPAAGRILRGFAPVIFIVLPELAPMAGFEQHSPYHDSDVWEHTLRALEASPRDPIYRLALLFHDCGKPDCFTIDENGRGHFYGHPKRSRELAEGALRRLKCDNDTLDRVLYLVEKHDTWLPGTDQSMRRFLLHEDPARVRDLLVVQRCDALAHAPAAQGPALANIDRWETLLTSVLAKRPCLSLKDLAVSGDDLLSLGMVPGPKMGKLLNDMLIEVVDGALPNERAALLSYAEKHI
ncbi:MAG: HD domain-containing protein [Clostridia bacterium]|nr:HD domain-containing protein [Clostridia bacterium]